ncbi:MAG: dTMP kinase [Candidatus Altiarchaeota archaeon]
MFIVLEGLDGCGKSTQAKLLADWLIERGGEVLLTAEPTRSRVGLFIREILASDIELDPKTLSLLFVADRIQHLKDEIEPALLAEKYVVSERYYYSTIAYQNAQEVSWDWLTGLNDFRAPDVSILLDVPPKKASEKIREKILREKDETERARKKFEEEKKKFEDHKLKFTEHRKRFHQIKKNPYAVSGSSEGKKFKHYLDERNASTAEKQLRSLMAELLELDEARMASEEEYEAARTKYLKFEKFERPTTLESDASEYDVFLKKVYENYHRFEDMTLVDGTKSIEKVAADIQEIVGAVL